MAEVVEADIVESGLLADAGPRLHQIDKVSAVASADDDVLVAAHAGKRGEDVERLRVEADGLLADVLKFHAGMARNALLQEVAGWSLATARAEADKVGVAQHLVGLEPFDGGFGDASVADDLRHGRVPCG